MPLLDYNPTSEEQQLPVDDVDEAAGVKVDKEPQPAGYQFLRKKKKNKSPPWNAAIAIDPNSKTVEITSKKTLEKDRSYVRLEARNNEVALFADYGVQNGGWGKPTTETTSTDDDGLVYSNFMLIKFRLNELPIGAMNRLFRFLGAQSTLYVKRIGPVDD